MTLPRLFSFPDAAKKLGVPVDSLRSAAAEHGKTVRIGRKTFLLEDDIKELILLCRDSGKAQDSTGDKGRMEFRFGRSVTDPIEYRPARTIADKLKGNSRNT